MAMKAAAAVLALWSAAATAATDLYRVELLVFRNADNVVEPATSGALRGFHAAWDLPEPAAPAAPVRGDTGSTFESLYSRLDRLGAYEPLLTVTWTQPAIEFQPPVRVHGEEIMTEVLHFPQESARIDLLSPRPFEDYLAPLFRLDGTVQLRRSRFLHLDLDLEWRVDDPAALQARPLPGPPGAVEAVSAEPAEQGPGFAPEADPGPVYRIHRLHQSRQVETDTMLYFDSDALGVLARVTALAAD